MVSEAVGFIGILLLAAAIIIGVYFWITVRLNGQTPDEYLNEFLDNLNEKKQIVISVNQRFLNCAPRKYLRIIRFL